jgi:hypothetical protein
MGQRLTWVEICRSESFAGRWVALDRCRYDQRGATHPFEGEVVDADEDLTELCHRMREASRNHCTIVFCDGSSRASAPPQSMRRGAPSMLPR